MKPSELKNLLTQLRTPDLLLILAFVLHRYLRHKLNPAPVKYHWVHPYEQ